MKRIILPYSAKDNPLGFPGEYPAETQLIQDKDQVKEGWIVVTDEEYRRRLDTHYQTVADITEADQQSKLTAERSKLSVLDGHFDAIAALVAKKDAGTDTNADALAVAWRSARAILGIRRVLIELARNNQS